MIDLVEGLPDTLRTSRTWPARFGCGREACSRDEAAVELLIGHARWLGREDFLGIAVEFGRGLGDGPVRGAVDWEAVVAGLDAGGLPSSGSEEQMLRLAASLAGGVRLDLGSVLSGLDERNAVLVAGAVVHAAGNRGVSLRVAGGVSGGERRRPGEGDPVPGCAGGPGVQGVGRLRRHGGVELLVVLPDGSKRMIPAGVDRCGAGRQGGQR